MATRQQLEGALVNADQAGDVQAAQQLARAIQAGEYDQPQNQLQPTQPTQEQLIVNEIPTSLVTPVESTPPLTELGFMDKVSEAFTGADRMTPTMETIPEIGRAPELNAMSVSAFKASLGLLTTGEIEPLKAILSQQFPNKVDFSADEKGNVIVSLPSGSYALNKPGMSAQDLMRGAFDFAAFTPAARAATIPAAFGKSAITEAAIEGTETVLGGEFTPSDVALAGGVGAAAKGLEDIISTGARLVKGTPASDVVESGKEQGVQVLTSDIRQPKSFITKTLQQTGEKIPLVGTGGLREAQQTKRELAVNDVVEKYGEYSYNLIVDSLKSQKNKIKKAAGNVLQNVGNKLDDVGEIGLSKTQQAIQDVSEALSKKGVIKSSGAIDDLKLLADTVSETPQTFTTLKENRTAFRDIISGADKAERSQLTSRAKSLLQKVGVAMKADMDSFAKMHLTPSEFSKWKNANKVYASEATKLTKTKLKNILDKGDVTPEAVKNMLFSQKPSEVTLLYRSLTPEGRANARGAIIGNIVNSLTKRTGGITPNSFATELGKYGIQVAHFFKGKDKRQLNGLLTLLNATRRAQDAAVTTPTGQQLLGLVTGAAAVFDPLLTGGSAATLGLSARLYESPAVRNALLKLDSIPRGTTRFDRALVEAAQVLRAGSQTVRESTKE